jgi:hypothetical protein
MALGKETKTKLKSLQPTREEAKTLALDPDGEIQIHVWYVTATAKL